MSTGQVLDQVMDIDEVDLTVDTEVDVNCISKHRSKVHQHFTKIENKFQCNHCKKTFNIEKYGCTSNRLKHLNSKHPSKVEKDQTHALTQKNVILQAFQKQQKNQSEADLQRLITRFIILTDQPFVITEAQSFFELMAFGKTNAPAIPSADTIRRKIFAVYDEEKLKISQKLQSAPGKISLGADCWTAATGKSFHGILASWIDADWNFQQVGLDFDILNGNHKGKSLAASMFKVMNEYGIASKLMAITTDNASNTDTMFLELQKILSEN
ncbi:unnamed protein product, partial [Allacma fusca]